MSYITDGTFWFFIIGICATIGIIYYLLNKKIDKLQQSLINLINNSGYEKKRQINEISELFARVENLENKTNVKPPKISESSSGIGVIVEENN